METVEMTKELIDFATIKLHVANYVREAAHVENDVIKDDSLIFKEGYFNSMGFIMLIAFIEEELGVKTHDEDLIEENFESINAISAFIRRKSNG